MHVVKKQVISALESVNDITILMRCSIILVKLGLKHACLGGSVG